VWGLKGVEMELHSFVCEEVSEKIIKFIKTLSKEERDCFFFFLKRKKQLFFLRKLVDEKEKGQSS